MAPLVVNTAYRGEGNRTCLVLKEFKYAKVVDGPGIVAGSAFPREGNNVMTAFIMTGSLEPKTQQVPHLKSRIRCHINANAPTTTFNAQGIASDVLTADIRWYPGTFDMRIEDVSPAQEKTLRQVY